MADRGVSLNIPSTNQDFKTNPVFKDQNSEQPKQFIDTFVDFLKSSSSYITSTLNEASTTESSHTETMNAIPDENSRIDFHNQPSTSKQLFTIIKPTITTQTDLMIHYYDIDPLTFDNQDQGAIKRPRLN